MSSPTQRSLKELRRLGFTAQVVERFCHFSKRRIDLFNFADIVYLCGLQADGGGGIVALQVTTASNQAARIAKIKAEPKALLWLDSGGRIMVHGWRKQKIKRGGKAVKYVCNETEIELKDFAEET